MKRSSTCRSRNALAAGAVAALCTGPIYAGSGDLDTSFASTGSVTTAVSAGLDIARAVALQADGKILAAGISFSANSTTAALTRHNTDGTLDRSFDADGIVTAVLGAAGGSVNAMAVQADGRIIIAGDANNGANRDFVLLRFRINGVLDTGFNATGKVQTTIGARDESINALAIQSDGKILAAGFSHNGSNTDFALARYLTDGTLDASFGSAGKVVTPIGPGADAANAIAIQPDGRIVVAGSSSNGVDDDFAVVRYLANGSLDATFGGDGIVTANRGTASYNEVANAIALQADGRILIGGDSAPATNPGGFEVGPDLTLKRFAPNGEPDFTFGGGTVVTDLARYQDTIRSLAIQPDGLILALGTVDNTTGDSSFALVRYRADGSEDSAFGAGGRFIDGVGYSNALALQPDGRAVAVGTTGVDFSLRRFLARDENNDGIAEGWSLTPGAFSFADAVGVPAGSVQSSNLVTIAGLQDGVRVPAKVCGGEMAVNGNVYSADLAYVQNGDRIGVRHTAAATPGTVTNTVLSVGGVPSTANPALLLGGVTSDTFSSTTVGVNAGTPAQGCQPVVLDTGASTTPSTAGSDGSPSGSASASASGGGGSSGGGGALGFGWLAVLALPGFARRGKRART